LREADLRINPVTANICGFAQVARRPVMNDALKFLVEELRATTHEADPYAIMANAANVLEAQAAKIEALEFDNASLLAELGNIQTNADQMQGALRRIFERKK
jgi:hypothetical protein